MNVVDFDRVTKRFGSTTAVSSLTLAVAEGEMFGLIGSDGAGKSTVIRLLCGLIASDGGQIRVLGRDPVREHAHLTRSIGYCSQRFSLYGDLTVDENLAFFADIHGVPDSGARRDRLLHLTQLTPFRARLATHLSGGMKQKLALACTLIHQPRVIVLDEPTTGVDPISRRELWKLLSEFLADGITIVLSTPYLDEAERCSRVALLHDGRLLALDTPAAMRTAHPGGLYEVSVADHDRAAERLRSMSWVGAVQLFGDRIHVRLATQESSLAPETGVARLTDALVAVDVPVLAVRPIVPSLEDVFIDRLTEVAS